MTLLIDKKKFNNGKFCSVIAKDVQGRTAIQCLLQIKLPKTYQTNVITL